MLNVTVIGTVRDSEGHLQNGTYTVEYKGRDIKTLPIDTDNYQINFNIGDKTHLGCSGTMRNDEVMYINFTNNAGSKFARQIYEYSGENVIFADLVCKDNWGLTTNISVDTISEGVRKLCSNGTGDVNIFRVYICLNNIFAKDSIHNWKLAKTIKTTEDCIDIGFVKSAYVRVEVETTIDKYTSELSSVEFAVHIRDTLPTYMPKMYMIEWE